MSFLSKILGSLVATVAASGLVAATPALAADYPTRPVRLVIPFGPGGVSDMAARQIGAKLAERLGQPVVAENKPGAATVVGMMSVKNAAPDGYTLLLGGSSGPMNQALDKSVQYNVTTDFTPISIVAEFPYLMMSNPQLPAKNVTELVAWLKSNPGKGSFAIGGIGSSTHFVGELFLSMTGTTAVPIPFSNSPGVQQSIITGESQFGVDTPSSSKGQVAAGRLRALGVTTAQRISAMPDVPTIAEAGVPGFEVTGFMAIVAPARTPPEIVALLSRELTAVMQDPALRASFDNMGLVATTTTPQAAARRYADELSTWTKLVADRKLEK